MSLALVFVAVQDYLKNNEYVLHNYIALYTHKFVLYILDFVFTAFKAGESLSIGAGIGFFQ